MRWKERRVVQQPVAVARAPTSAARAVVVAPALRVVHAVPPEQNGGGGVERGAVQRGMQREANAGNTERGRAGQRGQCEGNVRSAMGAAVAAPSGRRGGLGPGGGEREGEASAGEGPRGAGRPWGGGMVTGGDADAQRQLTMAGGAMGWEAAGREGGGAGAYLQSIVTDVAQRPVKDVGRRLEPASTR